MNTRARSSLVLVLTAAPLFAAGGCSDPDGAAATNANGRSQVPFGGSDTTQNFNGTGEQNGVSTRANADGSNDGSTAANSQNGANSNSEGVGDPTLDNRQGGMAEGNVTGNASDNSGQNNGGAAGATMASMAGAAGASMTAPASDGSFASAGCGQSTGLPASDLIANNFITFPPGYDGSTPMPLVFGFHGANRTNLEQRLEDSRTDGGILEQNYIVAYMKSAGGGWDLGSDSPRFNQARQAIFNQFCVDTSSVFAFGHSSGAQFITQMLGASDTELTGVVVVASSSYNNFPWEPIPTLSIHGLQDRSRGGDPDGTIDLVQYTTSNQCSDQTQPVNVAACNSIAAPNPAVDSGCRQYVGCNEPTIFCNHNDPNYNDGGNPTNHGWPCFANDEIFKFFEGLR